MFVYYDLHTIIGCPLFLVYMISWCNIMQETRKQQFIRGCDVIDQLPQSYGTVSIYSMEFIFYSLRLTVTLIHVTRSS